jgi:hypothetical protein
VVLVEVVRGLETLAIEKLQAEIVEAVHHQLRFRVAPRLVAEGDFEIRSGATGKMQLVETTGDQI